MIVLKISNASEVVASKVGKFLELLTPDSIDHTTVEDQVIKKMIENLAAEGIKGEIAAINGLELVGENFSVHKGLNVRKHAAFSSRSLDSSLISSRRNSGQTAANPGHLVRRGRGAVASRGHSPVAGSSQAGQRTR